MLIGLNGYARSGKDTVAQILVQDHGFIRIAFADILKTSLYTLNPIVDPICGFRVNDFVDDYGWDYAKENVPEVRKLLQRLGTDVVRDQLDPDLWVKVALANMKADENYCISDMRFPNEAEKITEYGGKTVRINRKGFGPANSHLSEIALDSWKFDYIIQNDKDLDYLREVADTIVH